MAIHCCYGCVPPKRTPTCKFDGTCGKYAEAKKKHDSEKAVEDKQKSIDCGITAQKTMGVYRASRANRPMQTRWKRRR